MLSAGPLSSPFTYVIAKSYCERNSCQRACLLERCFWSKKFSKPLTPLTKSLRNELFTRPAEEIDFASHRNSISPADNYHPKSWVLNLLNLLLVWIWIPLLRTDSLVKKAEAWVWKLVQMEDENTDYACLAPVNAPMNTLCCYIKEGPDSYSFRRHTDRLLDYMWVNHEGMLMNGTNGVQVWIDHHIMCMLQ